MTEHDADAKPLAWECPRCGYSLEGIRGTACPECGRVTDAAEQERLAKLRVLPRSLATIAQVGMVFTIVVGCWSAAATLIAYQNPSGRAGSATLEACISAMAVSIATFPLCLWVRRALPRIHHRNDALAWIAAHTTWIGPLVAVTLMRVF